MMVDSTIGSIRNLVESLVFLTMCRAMYHDVLGQAEYGKPAWLRRNIRELRKADLSVQDLVSQQEFLAALWIINELKW